MKIFTLKDKQASLRQTLLVLLTQTRHSQLHKDPTPINPRLSLRPQPITLLQLLSHPSLGRQTHNKTDTSFSVSRRPVKSAGSVCVCVCVRGDGEVHQGSYQQPIV